MTCAKLAKTCADGIWIWSIHDLCNWQETPFSCRVWTTLYTTCLKSWNQKHDFKCCLFNSKWQKPNDLNNAIKYWMKKNQFEILILIWGKLRVKRDEILLLVSRMACNYTFCWFDYERFPLWELLHYVMEKSSIFSRFDERLCGKRIFSEWL